MTTFKAQASFTDAQIQVFALKQGWVDLTDDEEVEVEDNITAEEFISNYMHKELMRVLGLDTIKDYEQEAMAEAQVKIEAYKGQLAQAINVTYE